MCNIPSYPVQSVQIFIDSSRRLRSMKGGSDLMCGWYMFIKRKITQQKPSI